MASLRGSFPIPQKIKPSFLAEIKTQEQVKTFLDSLQVASKCFHHRNQQSWAGAKTRWLCFRCRGHRSERSQLDNVSETIARS